MGNPLNRYYGWGGGMTRVGPFQAPPQGGGLSREAETRDPRLGGGRGRGGALGLSSPHRGLKHGLEQKGLQNT
jgi:hypothetical protein